MKIAFYFSPLDRLENPTGVGQHAVRMARALAALAGVELAIVSPSDQMKAAESLSSHIGSQVQIIRVPLPDLWVRRLCVLTSILSLDRWCGEFDWIYSPAEQPVLTRKSKLAVTIHDVLGFEPPINGLGNAGKPGWSARRRLGKALKTADVLACVSEFTRKRVSELLRVESPERLNVVGNGVGMEYFEKDICSPTALLSKFDLKPKNYLLLPGSLTFRKGGDLVIELARELEKRGSNLPIVVLGRRHDDELVTRLEQVRSNSPGLPIHLMGYVDQNEMPRLIACSRAVIFPTRYEGFGIPVLEAMACGVPCFISRQEAVREVGSNVAICVDSMNASDWIDAISKSLSNEQNTRSASSLGVKRARDYCWSSRAQKLVRLMENQMDQ